MAEKNRVNEIKGENVPIEMYFESSEKNYI